MRVLLLGMLISLLAGCIQAPARLTITFAFFGDLEEQAAYTTMASAFEQAHPNIAVELRPVPSQGEYLQRLAAEFSAGAPADVMLINYRRFAAFAAEQALEPLGPYLEQSSLIRREDFFPEALAAFTYADQLWCIPQNVSSLVVYYNRDLFDAAGVSYPEDGWTHDDFVAAARQLTRDLDGDGRTDQFGAALDPTLFRLAPFIWQEGGELVDDPTKPTRLTLDSPPALRALQWFVGLQTQEHVVPDATAEAAETAESRFLHGRLAMILNSRRGVPTYRTIRDFSWDVAPLPQGAQPAGILHSDAFCLAAISKNKEIAWSFIEFANSPEGQRILARSGRTVPSLVEVAMSSEFLEPSLPPAHSEVFVTSIPVLRTVPIMERWPMIEETASAEIERAFYGQAGVEEAAARAVELTLPYFQPTTTQSR